MITSTISWLDLTFTIIVICAVLTSLRRVNSVFGDFQALVKLKRNGTLAQQTRNDLRSEVLRLVINIGLLFVARIALRAPDPPHIWTEDALVFTGVLMMIPTLQAYDSWKTEVTRHRILDEMKDEEYAPTTH